MRRWNGWSKDDSGVCGLTAKNMTMPHTHRNDIEEEVDDLLRSPLGCAFLAIIDESETLFANIDETTTEILSRHVSAVRYEFPYPRRTVSFVRPPNLLLNLPE